MHSLTASRLKHAQQLARLLARGDNLSQAELDRLCAEWEPEVRPGTADSQERFALVRTDGTTRGIAGPRWAFHLFGLRHRAAEVAFVTETGLVLLQRRSTTKDQWPGALDMAVAGHIAQHEDGTDGDFEEGAWREIAEEIGLRHEDAASSLVEGSLTAVGDPYFCYENDPSRNPPFVDAEVRRIYAATITGHGLSKIQFSDGEVSGVLLVTVETAWQTLLDTNIAGGLRYSLPRYLDWLEQRALSR